jgi:hypothetical protein
VASSPAADQTRLVMQLILVAVNSKFLTASSVYFFYVLDVIKQRNESLLGCRLLPPSFSSFSLRIGEYFWQVSLLPVIPPPDYYRWNLTSRSA